MPGRQTDCLVEISLAPPNLGALAVIFRVSLTSSVLSLTTSLARILSLAHRPWITNDNVLPLRSFGLFWLNEYLWIVQFQHINRERSLVNLYLRKYQSSFINGRLYLSTKNITIISRRRCRVVPLTICMSSKLLRRRYSMCVRIDGPRGGVNWAFFNF